MTEEKSANRQNKVYVFTESNEQKKVKKKIKEKEKKEKKRGKKKNKQAKI